MQTVDGVPAQRASVTVARYVADGLRQDIIRGTYPVGTKLRQGEIARRFGVSTTPVREALVILQGDGLVRLDPQRGASVFVPSASHLSQLYEIRIALESLATAKAAERFLPEWAPPLEAYLDELRTQPDAERSGELNERFHLEIYERAARQQLLDLVTSLRRASSACLFIYRLAPGYPNEHLDSEHRRILQACIARDPDEAATATRDHLGRTVDRVVGWLETNQPHG
jgi:DNA-binding GntR family transcriptional regulator